MAEEIGSIAEWLKQYWYIVLMVVIAIIAIIIILSLRSRKTKREYYDEIARQKKIMNKEMEFNKSDYNFLVLKTALGKKKTLGQIVGYRTENLNFRLPHMDENDWKNPERAREFYMVKDVIMKAIGDDKAQEVKVNTITFSVKTKAFRIPLIDYKIWYGDSEIFITEMAFVNLNPIKSEIECDDDIGFKYRDGRFISTKGKVDEWFNEYETYRLLHDHSVNAFAYQQLRFAEIKDEYAQQVNLKEKDAEIEDRKRKTLMERS